MLTHSYYCYTTLAKRQQLLTQALTQALVRIDLTAAVLARRNVCAQKSLVVLPRYRCVHSIQVRPVQCRCCLTTAAHVTQHVTVAITAATAAAAAAAAVVVAVTVETASAITAYWHAVPTTCSVPAANNTSSTQHSSSQWMYTHAFAQLLLVVVATLLLQPCMTTDDHQHYIASADTTQCTY
jgi:hypothetical protein